MKRNTLKKLNLLISRNVNLMNLLTILFLTSTALSGVVVFGIGIANLPQHSTSYVEGSGETAETVAEKNRTITINSAAFKETIIGTGLIILFVISLVCIKYREEQLRIKDEARLEQQKIRSHRLKQENRQTRSVDQQLDYKIKEVPNNKPINVQSPEYNQPTENTLQIRRELKPITISNPRPQVTNPMPQVTNPRPQVTNPRLQVTNPRPQVTNPRPQVTNPQTYYPRPFNTLL